MDVDWWARGIGLAALIIALGGLGWRLLEFWLTGRADIKVLGSAGTAQQTNAGLKLRRGERFGYSLVLVDIINSGRRAVTIDTAGFWVPSSTRMSQIEPGIPDTLPKRLHPGDSVVVIGDALAFLDSQTEDLSKLRPYCEDAEGQTHKGKTDHHFRQLVANYRSQRLKSP